MNARRCVLEAAAGAVVLLWLLAAAGAVRVAVCFSQGEMFPVDGWSWGGEVDPTVLWPVPAAVGAILGVSIAVVGLLRPSPGLFRSALTAVTLGSLISLNNSTLFGDHAAYFATLGIAANAQSLAFSAAALGCIFVLHGIGIARTQETRTNIFWLATLSSVSFAVAGYATYLLVSHPHDPVQTLTRYTAFIFALTAPMAAVLLVAERLSSRVEFVLHRVPSALAMCAILYWGREACLPTPPTTPFHIVLEQPRVSSPWSDAILPLPSKNFEGTISINENTLSIDGAALCDIKSCTTELREKFEDHTARWEVVGRRPRPDFAVFASASTPLLALTRVVREARAAGMTIEVGVVRAQEQQRPVFGTMVSVEAGIVPGAADLIANSNSDRSWADWLAAL